MSPCRPSAANYREQAMRELEGLGTKTQGQTYRHKHRPKYRNQTNSSISPSNNKYLRNLLFLWQIPRRL